MRNTDLIRLEKLGMIVPGVQDFHKPEWMQDFEGAQDAQPQLVTVSNSGIPSYMANYIDPKLVTVLFAPMKAAEIVGEEKKGSWVDLTATFPVIEATGETSSYGDFSNNGNSGANTNFPQRQSYTYQTMTHWGERELEMAGLAKIDWVSQLNIASALTLNKFQNKTYFFGVANLQNYGLINDPNLSAPITATAAWSTSAADVIYEDIRRLFTRLQSQADGTIDNNTKMTLALSPVVETYLLKTNQYNVNVIDQLKKNFPNMRIVNAVEYNVVSSGQLVQLIADEVEGQKTATTAFTEKMRAHTIVRESSSFKQKKSQGSWGTVIFQPFAIASMQPIT